MPCEIMFFWAFEPMVDGLGGAEEWESIEAEKDGEGVNVLRNVAGSFLILQSMEKVHVWIALRQDEKQERLEKEAEIRRVREELLRDQASQKDSLA